MTPIETVEQLDEFRARSLEPLAWAALGMADTAKHAYARERSLRKAKEIREADERAGLVTVPREPTGDMLNAFSCAIHHWLGENGTDADVFKAVCAASPFASAAQGEGGE